MGPSYFPAQNSVFSSSGSIAPHKAKPPGGTGGARRSSDGGQRRLRSRRRLGHRATGVDEGIGDEAEADPTLHSTVAFVAAPIETVTPLCDADASFASRAPFLPVAEPPFLLLTFACRALGGTIGYTDPLDAHCLGLSVIFPGIEGGIGCYEVWRTVKRASMRFDGRNQHI